MKVLVAVQEYPYNYNMYRELLESLGFDIDIISNYVEGVVTSTPRLVNSYQEFKIIENKYEFMINIGEPNPSIDNLVNHTKYKFVLYLPTSKNLTRRSLNSVCSHSTSHSLGVIPRDWITSNYFTESRFLCRCSEKSLRLYLTEKDVSTRDIEYIYNNYI